jgi:asparagine synthetase B (glutamine-hydrolysing)
MKFKISYAKGNTDNLIEKGLPVLFNSKPIIIQGTNLLHHWHNETNDTFIVLGEIIGIRENGFKIVELTDYSILENTNAVSEVEGRFIVLKISSKKELSIWADHFGRVDLYWLESNKVLNITSGIDMFSESINKRELDQNGLAQALTIYGSRPLKKHTLFKNIFRLGVQEFLFYSNGKLEITKKKVEIKSTFPKDNKSKLDLYSDLFTESVRSRASKEQNIIFLSSGWDSTSILAMLVHLFGPSKIDCIIGRMHYSERSGIINQFEIDRALKMTEYFGVRLHMVELDYTENIEDIIAEVSPISQDQQFSSMTGYNHWLLAKGAKKIAKSGAVVFAGEISDGAHNLGFSQYFSIYHPASHSFREYSDKMASYLFGPTFLNQMINGTYENDPVWKIFKSYHEDTKLDLISEGENEIIMQLFSSFFLSGGRIPLFSKDNCSILTAKGRKEFLTNAKKVYLQEYEGKINQENLYAHYLHLYHSFHWQGGTVATLEHMCDEVGLKCRLPFLDQTLIEFLSSMPESWGRGLDLNNTKFPLKWMLSNKIDYPMDLQEGPHSYLYDVNPSFSHSDEIVNASSFTPIFKKALNQDNFLDVFDPEYFDLDYIKKIIKTYSSGKAMKGQELSDISNLGNLASLKLI